MGLLELLRLSRPQVVADVGDGFWVTEATALQRSISGALGFRDRHRGLADVLLSFDTAPEGGVVVVCRNRNIGFVPSSHAPSLRAQMSAARPATLTARGHVYQHGELWRVWAGPIPESGPPAPDPGIDQMAAPPTTILGIPMRGRSGPPSRDPVAPGRPAAPWILTVGTDSWDVRDGVDLDLAALRSRIAAASDGSTIHVRLWDTSLAIDIDLIPGTRVTLTPPGDGPVEVLYPRDA